MPFDPFKGAMKALGLFLALSFFALFTFIPNLSNTAHAHAEHGTEGGIPTIDGKARLPEGSSLQIVKTTAFQFAMATNGNTRIEVLGEDKKPFLRFDQQAVFADLNSTGWHRAQQPGGGPIPAFIKDNKKLKPNWVQIQSEPGYGWYDPRLMNESIAHFDLLLRQGKQTIKVRVERIEPEPMQGFWRPTQIELAEFDHLNSLIPGLSGNTLMVSRLGSADSNYQILDDKAEPFLELRADGVWLDTAHRWADALGLFYDKSAKEQGWTKVSASNTITFNDPRLAQRPAKTDAIGQWTVPVKRLDDNKVSRIQGELRWQPVVAK